METYEYEQKEKSRVENLFSTKHKNGFKTKEDFSDWYILTLRKQNYCCYYCETSIFDINRLIDDKKLKERKIGYGWRGRVLEIDRKTNGKGYNSDNCVLSCYYCNNDKSYTLDSEDYKMYFGENRSKYFKSIIKNENEI
jgi:hypothetical protein